MKIQPQKDDTQAPKTPKHECPICLFESSSASKLTAHMQTIHGK